MHTSRASHLGCARRCASTNLTSHLGCATRGLSTYLATWAETGVVLSSIAVVAN